MAQTAKTGADAAADNAKHATENVAEIGKRAAGVAQETAERAEGNMREGAQLVRRTTEAAGEVQRQVAHRSAEGTAELGQVLVDLMNEQTRHNVETFKALTGAVDWDRVVKVQGEFLRVTLERMVQLNQRYLDVFQSVVNAAVTTAKDQARKAA
jgi:hypothetical protein